MKLTLPLPPSANMYWRNVGGRVLLSKGGRVFKEEAGLLALAQRRGQPMDGPVSVDADFYFPDRRRDLDNALKPLLDVLEGVVYLNDRQVVEIKLRRHVDKSSPRVELTVEAA